MAINIRNNSSSTSAQERLGVNQGRLRKNIDRLSSGKRLNSAADDAAALAISEMFAADIRSLGQAQRNTMDGVSLLQTAEGGLSEMGELVGRMKELAVQASNGTLSGDQRAAINDEFTALREEIRRISDTSEFNGQRLLDGSLAGGMKIQVGGGADPSSDQISFSISQTAPSTLGDGSSTLDAQSLDSQDGARSALSVIDGALRQISSARGEVGAAQNRMTSAMDNLSIERENLIDANGRIEDADVASEVSQMVQNQILGDASASMLGQANRLSLHALSLLDS